MRGHWPGTLAAAVLVGCSLFMFACGGSPHDRAEGVMQSAVERLSALYVRVDDFVVEVQERSRGACEGVEPLPNSLLAFGKPRDLRLVMNDVNTEYHVARTGCNFTLAAIRRQLIELQELRDRLASEALAELVSSLRVRLATVPEDALERVLDATATEEEAWVALNQMNSSGFGRRVLDSAELALQLGEVEAQLNTQLDDVARYRSEAVEKKAEFYALAGEPVPEP